MFLSRKNTLQWMMYLTLWRILASLKCVIASPVSPPIAPPLSINTASSLSNLTRQLNTSDGGGGFSQTRSGLNYIFHIRYHFLTPHRSLDPSDLESLLIVAEDVAKQGVQRFGEDTRYPLDWYRDQSFKYNLGDHIGISVENSGTGLHPRFFTWGQLRDLIEDLQQIMVERRQNYEMSFAFWIGLETDPVLGLGKVTQSNE